MKIFSTNVSFLNPCTKVQQRTANFSALSAPDKDVFQHGVKKFPDFSCDTGCPLFDNIRDFLMNSQKKHQERMLKYATNQGYISPREVSKKEFEAMNLVQYELGEYSSFQKKLKQHISLTPKEEKDFSFVISQMKPTSENRVLWRAIGEYDGFEEQIKNGILKLDCLTSTNSQYDDFFEFWAPQSYVEKDGKLFVKDGYILKFNVPEGTKLLDCNAVYKNQGTRMSSEVILPPSNWQVNSIDNDLNVIELSPLKG